MNNEVVRVVCKLHPLDEERGCNALPSTVWFMQGLGVHDGPAAVASDPLVQGGLGAIFWCKG